jgi:hypothetical protein
MATLRKFLAINIIGQGYILQNERCVEYTPKLEDASLFSSKVLAGQVIESYDYKDDEFKFEEVNVLALHGNDEATASKLFLTLSLHGHKTEAFAVLLSGTASEAIADAHNAASVLKVLFANALKE